MCQPLTRRKDFWAFPRIALTYPRSGEYVSHYHHDERDTMNIQEMRKTVIAINDARLEGRITREIHATQIAEIDAQLTAAGLSWDALA